MCRHRWRSIASVQQIPMAIAANTDRVLGFQFHPESIMTTAGTQLLKQSIEFLGPTRFHPKLSIS